MFSSSSRKHTLSLGQSFFESVGLSSKNWLSRSEDSTLSKNTQRIDDCESLYPILANMATEKTCNEFLELLQSKGNFIFYLIIKKQKLNYIY